VLFTGPQVDKVRRTIDFILGFINRYYPQEVDLHVVELPVNDLAEAVRCVKSALRSSVRGSDSLVVNLSGGMRLIILSVFLALLMLSEELPEYVVEVETEDSQHLVVIPRSVLLLVKQSIGPSKIKLLEAIMARGGRASLGELVEALNVDQSTLRRHLHALRELGLLEYEATRPLTVKLREEAKMFT